MSFLQNLRFRASSAAVKFGAGVTALTVAAASHAQSTGINEVLDAVDLSGIGAKVGAAALLIVAIALVFKGPTLAKRVISKV